MNDIVTVEQAQVPQVFVEGGLEPFIQKIREEVTADVYDISTAKGRKECASAAHKVARSKTYLDGLGKDLVTDIKAKAKVIDAERKRMRDILDDLKSEVRAPLDAWEQEEQQRVENIKYRIDNDITAAGAFQGTADAMDTVLADLEAIAIDDSFAEFTMDAAKAKDAAVTALKARIIVAREEERQAAEAARLEAERQENERREREERIAQEAAEKAKQEAEAAAQAEINRARQAEEQAQREASEAKAREEQAAEAERQRIAAEQAAKEAEEARRAKDIEHRREVHAAATSAIAKQTGIDDAAAARVLDAIICGYVPNVTINY